MDTDDQPFDDNSLDITIEDPDDEVQENEEAASTSSRSTLTGTRARSVVWTHFQRGKDERGEFSKCKYCM